MESTGFFELEPHGRRRGRRRHKLVLRDPDDSSDNHEVDIADLPEFIPISDLVTNVSQTGNFDSLVRVLKLVSVMGPVVPFPLSLTCILLILSDPRRIRPWSIVADRSKTFNVILSLPSAKELLLFD